MTNQELSDQFDVIFNNITSNQAPGLDEYEKSVLLTKAQDQIIKAYFSPKTNKLMEGYDDSQRRNIDFSTLTTTKTFEATTGANAFKIIDKEYSQCYKFPTDIIAVLNETVKVSITTTIEGSQVTKSKILQVIPIAYDLYTSLMNKPHKQPVKNSAWRLFTGYVESDDSSQDSKPYPVIQIIGHKTETLGEYLVRYIKRPKPIILAEFDGVSIEDYDKPWAADGENACELPNELQPDVIQRAVELAKAVYLGDLSTQIQVGQASQTDLGFVSSGNSRRE